MAFNSKSHFAMANHSSRKKVKSTLPHLHKIITVTMTIFGIFYALQVNIETSTATQSREERNELKKHNKLFMGSLLNYAFSLKKKMSLHRRCYISLILQVSMQVINFDYWPTKSGTCKSLKI